ncbi:MAG: hypothetical protein AAF224_09650 [Pseudomonadota bacterium]
MQIVFVPLLLGVFLSVSSAFALEPSPSPIMIVGDTPYAPADEAMLAKALPAIKSGGFPFVIHLGDYKGGKAPCDGAHDEAFEVLIDTLAPLPVFYTPGDNEWTDCDRNENPATGARYSDLKRLQTVREKFAADVPAGADAFDYRRQLRLPENASWSHQGVRYLTLHVTGTNNGRDWVVGDALEAASAAVAARDAANSLWLAEGFVTARNEKARAMVIALHADPTDIKDKPKGVMCESVAVNDDHACDAFTALRRAINDGAATIDAPVLLIHGDTEPFTLSRGFGGEDAPNLWRLNAAGDAGVGRTGFAYGVRDVTVVEFHLDEKKPFRAYGLLTGKKARAR